MDAVTENRISMLKIIDLDTPFGLANFIFHKTDFQRNPTVKVARYVEVIDEYAGKLVKRIFAFKSKTKERTWDDLMITEVYRRVEGQKGCLLRNIWSGMNGKNVDFYSNESYFWSNDHDYNFYNCWSFYSQKSIIEKYDLKYCQWFSEKNKTGMSFFDFICAYRAEPKIELLIKADLPQFVHCYKKLNLKEKSLDKIFRINNYWVNHLREMYYSDIMMIKQKSLGIKTWDDLLFMREHSRMINSKDHKNTYIRRNVKMYKYLLNYKEKKNIGTYSLMVDYNDYLGFCATLGLDLKDEQVLYPKDLKRKHDEYMELVKIHKENVSKEQFFNAYMENLPYVFSKNELVIIPCESNDQLIEESNKLGHCVHSYAKRYQDRETNIFFIRHITDIENPYVTLELRGKKVIQCRGNGNTKPVDSVIDFVADWCKMNEFKSCFVGE